jgi:membrane protein CcdC involved in cytochrome C biogenesis
MIKVMKLQKAVIAMLLGIIALVIYMIMSATDISWSKYILEASGLFLMSGALLFLYPILFARKDKGGCVELDPEAPVTEPVEVPKTTS